MSLTTQWERLWLQIADVASSMAPSDRSSLAVILPLSALFLDKTITGKMAVGATAVLAGAFPFIL